LHSHIYSRNNFQTTNSSTRERLGSFSRLEINFNKNSQPECFGTSAFQLLLFGVAQLIWQLERNCRITLGSVVVGKVQLSVDAMLIIFSH